MQNQFAKQAEIQKIKQYRFKDNQQDLKIQQSFVYTNLRDFI